MPDKKHVPHSNTGPFGIPPGGPWFAYALTGTVQRQSNPVLATTLVEAGWVGFATKKDAQLFLQQDPISKGKQAAGDLNPLKPITNAVDFLTSPDAWVRIGEVVAGLVLLYAGITAILKVTPIESAVKTGSKVALL